MNAEVLHLHTYFLFPISIDQNRLFALRNNDTVNRLAMMSVILGIGALVTGYYGQNIPHLTNWLTHNTTSLVALVATSIMAVASIGLIVYVVGINWRDYRASILPNMFRKPLSVKMLRQLRRYDRGDAPASR